MSVTLVSMIDPQVISTIVNSVVTFIVGLVAFFVYRKGRNDTKKDAARTIVLELKTAQQHLLTAKESIIKDRLIKEDLFILRSTQWEKHKYLFARDLKADELAELNAFYEKCISYDEIVKYYNGSYRKNEEEIRLNLQSALADYTKGYIADINDTSISDSDDDKRKAYESLIDKFADEFMKRNIFTKSAYFYMPEKTFSDAEAIVHTVNVNMTSTPAYRKLQSISNQTLRTRIFDWLTRDKDRL